MPFDFIRAGGASVRERKPHVDGGHRETNSPKVDGVISSVALRRAWLGSWSLDVSLSKKRVRTTFMPVLEYFVLLAALVGSRLSFRAAYVCFLFVALLPLFLVSSTPFCLLFRKRAAEPVLSFFFQFALNLLINLGPYTSDRSHKGKSAGRGCQRPTNQVGAWRRVRPKTSTL